MGIVGGVEVLRQPAGGPFPDATGRGRRRPTRKTAGGGGLCAGGDGREGRGRKPAAADPNPRHTGCVWSLAGACPGARIREDRPMMPTTDSDNLGPDDEAFVRVPEVPDPAADDPDHWWLDLGRV